MKFTAGFVPAFPVSPHPAAPLLSVTQIVPLKYQNPCVVVSYTKRPVAGVGMAMRSAEVMRGISSPFFVPSTALASMSSSAEGSGVAPLALMPMFWARV